MATKTKLVWKCDTPSLLKEIAENNSHGALNMPLTILLHILGEVATRASELNDPKLNALMCRLTLYEAADQHSPNYNEEVVKQVMAAQGWG